MPSNVSPASASRAASTLLRSKKARLRRHEHFARRLAVTNLVESVAHGRDSGICFKRLRHDGQFLLRPPIVAVKKCDDRATQFWNRSVEGRSLAAIFFSDVADPRQKFLDDRRRAVRRAVVHHHDFHFFAREILFQHAHDGLLDIALVVVGIDQD